jgi:hypothetical protein
VVRFEDEQRRGAEVLASYDKALDGAGGGNLVGCSTDRWRLLAVDDAAVIGALHSNYDLDGPLLPHHVSRGVVAWRTQELAC